MGWDEAHSKAGGHELGVVARRGLGGLGKVGTGQERREMQSRTDPVIPLS